MTVEELETRLKTYQKKLDLFGAQYDAILAKEAAAHQALAAIIQVRDKASSRRDLVERDMTMTVSSILTKTTARPSTVATTVPRLLTSRARAVPALEAFRKISQKYAKAMTRYNRMREKSMFLREQVNQADRAVRGAQERLALLKKA